MQEYSTRVIEIKYLTLETIELTTQLVAPGEIRFKAGQYMQFKIGSEQRSFCIVSVPQQSKALTFCVELMTSGVGSDFVRKLKVGDNITMSGPFGTFTVSDLDHDV